MITVKTCDHYNYVVKVVHYCRHLFFEEAAQQVNSKTVILGVRTEILLMPYMNVQFMKCMTLSRSVHV